LQDFQSSGPGSLQIGLADYNFTVLQLVTLPNVLLSWAKVESKEPWEAEGELEIDPELITKFIASLELSSTVLSFYSGAWCPDFVGLVGKSMHSDPASLMVLGAETIYSPFALKSFAETLSSLMESTPDIENIALVGAKKVYFGVGGSMEDFCQLVREKGATVETIREESDGVRRAVVEVKFPST
jgi:protein-histidine N-methyltransferase